MIQTWKNGMLTLRVGAVTSKINIFRIKPYTMENSDGRSLLQYR